MDINDVVIDDEYLNLCIRLKDEEFRYLKAGVLSEGFRNPLVVWKGHNILLDGHTRYRIWKSDKSGTLKPPSLIEIDLPDRDTAHDWIINNQLGRRNCTRQQKFYLRGKRYLAEKKREGAPKNNVNAGKNEEKQLTQTGAVVSGKRKRTTAQIGEEFCVSRNTIARDASYAKVIDELAELSGKEAKEAVLSGGVNLGHQMAPGFLKLDKQKKKKAAKMVAEQSVKSVEEAVKLVSGNGKEPATQRVVIITVLQVKNLHKLCKEVKRLVDRPSSELSKSDINLQVDALLDLVSKIHSKLK